jgi:hypothetical protein
VRQIELRAMAKMRQVLCRNHFQNEEEAGKDA